MSTPLLFSGSKRSVILFMKGSIHHQSLMWHSIMEVCPCYRAVLVIMAERMLQSFLLVFLDCRIAYFWLLKQHTGSRNTWPRHSPCWKCIPISTEQKPLTEILIWYRYSVGSSVEHSCTKVWMVCHNSWMWFHCSFNLINLCSQFTISCHSSETYLPT